MEEQEEVYVTDLIKFFLVESLAFIMLMVVESLFILLLWNNVVATAFPSAPIVNIWQAIAVNAIMHMPVITKIFY